MCSDGTLQKADDSPRYLAAALASDLTSRQIVEELLRCGAEVHLVNRKKILHAKCYGAETSNGDSLIVSSGNFTGPGMSQNIEGSIFLDPPATRAMSFRWRDALAAVLMQRMALPPPDAHLIALLLLGNCSMTRSLAKSEWTKVRTSLSCWSSATQIPCAFKPRPAPSKHKARNTSGSAKTATTFLPPLTIPNVRGAKRTYFVHHQVGNTWTSWITDTCRVTFEAENSLDFRLGTWCTPAHESRQRRRPRRDHPHRARHLPATPLQERLIHF